MNQNDVGRSVDEALRLIKAYQFSAEHGEVCPANWTPGAKTMKPGESERDIFVFGGYYVSAKWSCISLSLLLYTPSLYKYSLDSLNYELDQ